MKGRSTRAAHPRTSDWRTLKELPDFITHRDWLTARAFSALVDDSPDAIFAKDLEGRYLLMNRAGASIFARAVDEIVGCTDFDLFSADAARSIVERDQRILASGQSESYEAESVANGVSRWFLTSKHLLRDEAWTPIGLIGIARDITERKRIEDALRDSRQQLEEAQTLARIGSWLATLDGEGSLTWSRETHRIFGLDEAVDPTMARFWSQVHPDDRAAVEAATRSARDDDVPYSIEHRVVRLDGEVRWVHERATVVRDPLGAPLRMVGTVQDITDIKQMQERLVLADRMAAMGTLAAGVGHEINNPLAFVIGNLEFIRDQLGEPRLPERRGELVEAIDDALHGARRVRDIVHDLKVFSRDDDQPAAAFDIRTAAEFAISMADNEIRHRARLVRDYGQVPLVRANEHRVGQVLLNLLINAAHALPIGHADAHEIRVVLGTAPSGDALIEVHDTGGGMTPEVQRRIFDPFFTTKPVGVGTGLGLSICHAIVRALGGDISVTSTLGVGTKVRVVLPVATALEKSQ